MSKKTRKYYKRNKKGRGFLKLFTRRENNTDSLPISSVEEFNSISKPINDVKEIFEKHSHNIQKLYHDCRNTCKIHECLGNEALCEQLNDMINTKDTYSWTYFCGNTLQKEECKQFLNSYKILEIYTNKLITLGEQAQKVKELLNLYKKPYETNEEEYNKQYF